MKHWEVLQEALSLWRLEDQDCVIMDGQGGKHFTHRILLSLLCPALSSLGSLPSTQTVCVSLPAPTNVVTALLDMLDGKEVKSFDGELLLQVMELARTLGIHTHTWTMSPRDSGLHQCEEGYQEILEPILETVLDVEDPGEESDTDTLPYTQPDCPQDVEETEEESNTQNVSVIEAMDKEILTDDVDVILDSFDLSEQIEDCTDFTEVCCGRENSVDESHIDKTTLAEIEIINAHNEDSVMPCVNYDEEMEVVFENILEIVEEKYENETVEEECRTEPNLSVPDASNELSEEQQEAPITEANCRACKCVEDNISVGANIAKGAGKIAKDAEKMIGGSKKKTTGSVCSSQCLKCGRQRRRPGLRIRNRQEQQELVTGVMGKWKGPRFPCNQCMYVACRAANLESHKITKHKGVMFMDTYITDYFSKNKLMFI